MGLGLGIGLTLTGIFIPFGVAALGLIGAGFLLFLGCVIFGLVLNLIIGAIEVLGDYLDQKVAERNTDKLIEELQQC